jgi:ankyrin repeat protein
MLFNRTSLIRLWLLILNTLLILSLFLGPDLVTDSALGEDDGHKAMMKAVLSNDTRAIEELLKQGVNINLPSNPSTGLTPLHLAVFFSKPETVLLLIQKGADIDLGDAQNRTPLIVAAIQGKNAAAKLLLENGAKTAPFAVNGMNALHWAAAKGNTPLVALLLDYGADVNAKNEGSMTPLGYAQMSGKAETIQFLENRGARLR